MSSQRNAERSRLINQTCVPLFLGHYWLRDGVGADAQNGTGTLVKFDDRLFILTCGHVRAQAYGDEDHTARILGESFVLNLSSWTPVGLSPSLREVKNHIDRPDISFCELPMDYLDLLSRTKSKTPIDLDAYAEPDWQSVQWCLAAGFPTRHKSRDGQALLSPMVEVIAELASPLGARDKSIVLHSELPKPSKFGFSGMSGGPVFALSDDPAPKPLGIIFEGHPSGETAVTGSEALLGPKDVLIRGLVLTPTTFESWLQAGA